MVFIFPCLTSRGWLKLPGFQFLPSQSYLGTLFCSFLITCDFVRIDFVLILIHSLHCSGCTSDSNQCIKGGAEHNEGCNKYECNNGKLKVISMGALLCESRASFRPSFMIIYFVCYLIMLIILYLWRRSVYSVIWLDGNCWFHFVLMKILVCFD